MPECQDPTTLMLGCASVMAVPPLTSHSAVEPPKWGESRKSSFSQTPTIQDYSPLLEYNNVHLEAILFKILLVLKIIIILNTTVHRGNS